MLLTRCSLTTFTSAILSKQSSHRLLPTFLPHVHTRPATTFLKLINSVSCKMSSSEEVHNSLPTFADFLHERYQFFSNNPAEVILKAKEQGNLHVIMGNEAGDCDSIISSLALTYIYSNYEQGTGMYLPLCSINRDDMSLRGETTLLLERCGINVKQLIYLDDDVTQALFFDESSDISPSSPNMKDFVQITLTDHNRIRSSMRAFSDNVIGIIDHHLDEKYHESAAIRSIAFDENRQKALSGSCCSLVTEELLKVVGTSPIDPALASALLGTIVLDTMNMNEKANKGTERDLSAIRILEKSSSKILSPDLDSVFSWMNNAKFDRRFWSELSVWDCLRIDYKMFETEHKRYGISSVLIPINELFEKEGFSKVANKFMHLHDLDLLAIMSMVIESGVPTRELLLYGSRLEVESMAAFLVNDNDAQVLKVKFSTVTEMDSDIIAQLLSQENPRGSRKQVAPIMLKK